jgi:hypothetical protein
MGFHLPCILCCNTIPIIRHIGRVIAHLRLNKERGANSPLLMLRAHCFRWAIAEKVVMITEVIDFAETSPFREREIQRDLLSTIFI